MNLLLRTMLFGVVAAGAVWGDETYQRPQEAASANAAVAQVQGDAIALTNLQSERRRGAWIDLATAGAILFAGMACFATWRPAPFTRVDDRRSQSLPKESV